jgi:phosphate transport system substrate-binding protein
MPINLVEASFTQIAKIPGAVVQNINIQSCNNPTFTPSGENLLAETAPQPPACDKQGPTQCTTGTGRAAKVSTPVSATPKTTDTTKAVSSSTRAVARVGSATTVAPTASTASTAPSASSVPTTCDPASGTCPEAAAASTTSAPSQTALFATPATLPATSGWSSTQTLIVVVLLVLLVVILGPGLLSRRLKRREP